jgi:ribosome-associated heat shock protein Hsp15
MASADDPGELERGAQRLDKWLWFARVTKSRTLAAGAVSDGKIKVNRIKAEKPSQLVKVGDVVTSRVHKNIRVLRIAALGERRGPASEAAGLYEDLTPPGPRDTSPGAQRLGGAAEAASAVDQPWGSRMPGSGRPTKRERRLTDQLKGGEE